MKLVPSETTLVLAGAWNPAILTPPWILRHGLEIPENQPHMIQALIPAGLNGAFDFPRYSVPGFQFTARQDAFILMPEAASEASLNLVETVACRALKQLSHTPIGGVGHNFEFIEDAPEADWIEAFSKSQLDLVDAAPEGLEAQRTTLATTFIRGTAQVNVQRYFDGSNIGIKFNFHHPAATAEEALKVLEGDGHARFFANYEAALNILKELYRGVEDV